MGDQIRVLLADDAIVTRTGWNTILSTDPEIKIVGEAATTFEALDKFKSLNPDVVLMDLKWGSDKTAGWSAIREMRKMNRRAKIIAITAYEELIFDARRQGADAALSKDFRSEELLTLIKELHKGRFDLNLGQGPDVPLGDLTPRETDVLRLVAEGYSDKEVAEKLVVSESTAKNHMRIVLEKLGAKNRTHAVKIARERGILQ